MLFLFCSRVRVPYILTSQCVLVVSFLHRFCKVTTIFFNKQYFKNFFISKFGCYICSSEGDDVLTKFLQILKFLQNVKN